MALLPFGSPPPKKPGGTSGNIQFNNSGSFGGDSNLAWDNTNKRLGINQSTPLQSFDETGILMVRGTYGSGETLSVTGQGARMFFYPKKSAFRAGYAFSTEWDDANIGLGSIALGYQASATKTQAITIGSGAVNTGLAAINIGGSTVSAQSGIAIGSNHNISDSDFFTTCIGTQQLSSGGGYNTLIGAFNTLGGQGSGLTFASVCIGYGNSLDSYVGVAIGYDVHTDQTVEEVAVAVGISLLCNNAVNSNMLLGMGDITGGGSFYMTNAYDGTLGLGMNTSTPLLWITPGDGTAASGNEPGAATGRSRGHGCWDFGCLKFTVALKDSSASKAALPLNRG